MAELGVFAYELVREQADLEQVFLQLTAGEALDSAPPAPSAPPEPQDRR